MFKHDINGFTHENTRNMFSDEELGKMNDEVDGIILEMFNMRLGSMDENENIKDAEVFVYNKWKASKKQKMVKCKKN